MESWLPIKDFYNYEISDKGRVRNIKTKRILKTNINSRGYIIVCLHQNNKQYVKRVHRLVAEAFYEGNHKDLDVNHIDGDKTNNFIENLEWCTRKENLEHAYRTGLKSLPNKTKVLVIETGKIYDSISECSKAINGDRCQIHRCLIGKERTCKGYHFKQI